MSKCKIQHVGPPSMKQGGNSPDRSLAAASNDSGEVVEVLENIYPVAQMT